MSPKLAKFTKRYFFSKGFADSSSDLAPAFTWSNIESSADGIPILTVHFPDGGFDAALLKRFNPIPKRSHEDERNIDGCIFEGFLRKESDVYVTITGGCPFSDNFEVLLNLNLKIIYFKYS